MKVNLLITIIAACILSSGCSLGDNLLRTSVVQPLKYSNYWDEKLDCHRFRKLAQLELERARCLARAESDNYDCPPFSIDQEKGFEAGFVDYLMYGGTGSPPPMPPRKYWWSGCETHLSCSAIEDWYRGFQHGAAVAQASGYRSCVTVPLSDSLYIDTRPQYPGQVSEYPGLVPEDSGLVPEPSDVEPLITPPGVPEGTIGSETLVPGQPGTAPREPVSPTAVPDLRPALAADAELIETDGIPDVSPRPTRLPSPVLSDPENGSINRTTPGSPTDGLLETETVPLGEPAPDNGRDNSQSSGALLPPAAHHVAEQISVLASKSVAAIHVRST